MNPLGYIVLTEQQDRTWRDDWDGCVHIRKDDACRELENAGRLCTARLVACYPASPIVSCFPERADEVAVQRPHVTEWTARRTAFGGTGLSHPGGGMSRGMTELLVGHEPTEGDLVRITVEVLPKGEWL